jgi:hypothetical protein
VRILFDQGTPVPLRRHLVTHDVSTAYELGWSRLSNGALLDAAERDGFDVLVTTDLNLKHQQNLSSRIAIVVLTTTNWPRIRRAADRVVAAIDRVTGSGLVEVTIP